MLLETIGLFNYLNDLLERRGVTKISVELSDLAGC